MNYSQFSTMSARTHVDTKRGIIFGVSVITKGTAQTHGLIVDDEMLSQVFDCAKQFRDGLRVRLNHPEAGKSTVESTAGTLRDFRREGDRVRGNLYLLQSEPNFNKLLEMSVKMPSAFGLSIAFSGTPEEIDGERFARCAELYACDLVSEPAANPNGLFHKLATYQSTAHVKKSCTPPIGSNGKKLTGEELRDFCLQKKREGAEKITNHFHRMNQH
jgi:hypothetical protein